MAFLFTGMTALCLSSNIGYLYGDTLKERFIAGPDVGIRHYCVFSSGVLTLGGRSRIFCHVLFGEFEALL